MANTLRVKRRVTGSPGAPSALKTAELAWSMVDNVLYGGYGDDGGGNATSVVPLGGTGYFAPLASPALTGNPTAPTQAANDNSTKIATTAFVLGQLNSTSGTITMNGSQAAGSSALAARADHVHPTDTSRAPLASPGLTGVPTAPTAAADTSTTQLATTGFVTGQAASTTPVINGTAAVGTSLKYARADHVHANQRLDQLLAPTASVAMGSQKITGLADPTSAQDAATKNYVDSVIQGLDIKPSVRAATTANIATLAGGAPSTLDGVTLVVNDRVLVKNQSTPSQNGIYAVTTLGTGSNGTWTRVPDMDSWAEVPGSFTFVEEGTTQADTSWVCGSDGGGTLGTTAINWTQFGAAGGYAAGNGIALTGNVFSANLDGSSLSVSGSGIRISATYAGQNSIVTVGTIGTGTWQGTAVAVPYGGTGVSTLTGLVKGNGASAFSAAVAGTDYHDTSSTIDGGTF